MDEHGLDITWVRPELALGGKFGILDVERIALELGIRRIVDLRAEARDDESLLRRFDVGLLHLPTPDHHPLEPAQLEQGLEWVRAGLKQGERVLIHCEHGIGRSPFLTACVLFVEGVPLRDALSRMKRSRCKVSPSPVQLEALLEWARRKSPELGIDPPSETWHELASIVYRKPENPGTG